MASTTYYWDEDDDNVCCEEDENGEITASYTHEPSLYGEVIAEKRGDDIRYFNFDGEGNTSELTDANENVTDTYEYSAFGEEVARTGTTVNPFGYKGALGYYTDGETNALYVRARMYEPTKLARFMSRDPISGNGIEILHPILDLRVFATQVAYAQPYIYVHNNPLRYADPAGTQEVEIIPISLQEAYDNRTTQVGRDRIAAIIDFAGFTLSQGLARNYVAGCSPTNIPGATLNCGAAWANRHKTDLPCGCEYIVQVVNSVHMHGNGIHSRSEPTGDAKIYRRQNFVEGFSIDLNGLTTVTDVHAIRYSHPFREGKARMDFYAITACCGNYLGLKVGPRGYEHFGPGVSIEGVNCAGPVTHYFWEFRSDDTGKYYFKVQVPTGTTLYEEGTPPPP
jgi:RHS repeat-associated protein